MPRLVIIEDGTILRMINDAQLSASIPCLYGKRNAFKTTGGGGCGSCARKRASTQRIALNQIKTCLGGLSLEKRQLLKNWLGAEDARVVYTNNAGQVVQINF